MTITLFAVMLLWKIVVCARGIENKIIIKPSLDRLYGAVTIQQ